MNTYIIAGALVLIGGLSAIYLSHRFSYVKDCSHGFGYQAGYESRQREINDLQAQIDHLLSNITELSTAHERDKAAAREALEQAVHDADHRIADAERRALSAEDEIALRCFATQLEAAATTCRNVGATVAADNMKRGAAIARALADRIIPTTESVQLEAAA